MCWRSRGSNAIQSMWAGHIVSRPCPLSTCRSSQPANPRKTRIIPPRPHPRSAVSRRIPHWGTQVNTSPRHATDAIRRLVPTTAVLGYGG
ncbi:hypothetical protein K439DRAFT_413001 [Ramaria rubella]|nr:hypothetical protein K439DRAFT_413001 [Ramaria rubella]